MTNVHHLYWKGDTHNVNGMTYFNPKVPKLKVDNTPIKVIDVKINIYVQNGWGYVFNSGYQNEGNVYSSLLLFDNNIKFYFLPYASHNNNVFYENTDAFLMPGAYRIKTDTRILSKMDELNKHRVPYRIKADLERKKGDKSKLLKQ